MKMQELSDKFWDYTRKHPRIVLGSILGPLLLGLAGTMTYAQISVNETETTFCKENAPAQQCLDQCFVDTFYELHHNYRRPDYKIDNDVAIKIAQDTCEDGRKYFE